jgi:signal transduction histidine kinase
MRKELAGVARRYGDAALAAALAGIALVQALITDGSADYKLAQVGLAIVLGICAARRVRAPLLLLGVLLAITIVATVVPRPLGQVDNAGLFAILLLAVYSAAAHTAGRETRLAVVLIVSLYLLDMFAIDPAGANADGAMFYATLYGAPWVIGRAVRQRRLNDAFVEEERLRAAAAIAEERGRIARELHDVVAHSISVMVLQARGGRRVLPLEPDDARGAFVNIERTGEQALDEMRRLLGLLRRSDEELALAPQPSLRSLDGLVEQVRAAGLTIDVVVEGEPRDLPPGVDLSAYRILQEALTNALRHAGPARASVLLRYRADDLELEVSDDGPGTDASSGAGYGLIGMRERVSVYGGELQAGRQPEGGYRLRVRLPLRSVRT